MKRIFVIVSLVVLLVIGVVDATEYPIPFLVGNSSDVAIIYGTNQGASSLELVQAGNLQADLQKRIEITLGNVLIKDSEISSVLNRNLIVLGLDGHVCSNSVFKEINRDCKTSGLVSGQFSLEVIANPFSSGKIILVIKGYGVAEIVNAVSYLRNNGFDTSVGSKYIGGEILENNDSSQNEITELGTHTVYEGTRPPRRHRVNNMIVILTRFWKISKSVSQFTTHIYIAIWHNLFY